jgi:hypothetical protein
MAVRSFVTFDVVIEEAEPDTAGERMIARNLTEYVALHLRTRGFATTPVAEHDSYGWYAEVTVEGGVIWIMLQRSDHWLMITRPIVPLLRRPFRTMRESEHQRVSEAIHGGLLMDNRFQNVRWYTRDEFDAHGAGSTQP